MAKKGKVASSPDPTEPGSVPPRASSTPERMSEQAKARKVKDKAAAQEIDEELDDALEHTFPASDPISLESTLVPGGRR